MNVSISELERRAEELADRIGGWAGCSTEDEALPDALVVDLERWASPSQEDARSFSSLC